MIKLGFYKFLVGLLIFLLVIAGLIVYIPSIFGPKAIVVVRIEKVSCNDSFVNIAWSELRDKPALRDIFLEFLRSNNTYSEYKFETSPDKWARIQEFLSGKGRFLKIDNTCFEIKFIGAMFAD